MSTTMLTTVAAVMLLHWIVLVTPGPNVIVVSHLAADGHRKAACFAALGITAVALIWSLLAILGVNAVFAAHPRLRLMLQIAGGIYSGVRVLASPDPGRLYTAAQGLEPHRQRSCRRVRVTAACRQRA